MTAYPLIIFEDEASQRWVSEDHGGGGGLTLNLERQSKPRG